VNPDMADLDLGTQSLSVTAQVNNYANPVFDLLYGPGSLTGSGTYFELNMGTLMENTGPFTVGLALTNDTEGPSDLLSGTFDISGISSFGLSGFDVFTGLDAGSSTGELSITFDPTTLGFYDEMLTLSAFGYNASGFEQEFAIILKIQAGVAPIPEPGTLTLLFAGVLALTFVARRRSLVK
jgi:hypothetical protein